MPSPEYVEYTEDFITISQNNTMLSAQFKGSASNFSIDKYLADDQSGYIYHISAWNTLWDQFTSKENLHEIILNPNGEPITSIYYSPNDGSADILIHGISQTPNGGIVTLPRLFLNYYAFIAILIVLLCVLVAISFRKNKRVIHLLTQFLLLPLSYLVSQFFITGFNATSYSATRDLYAILLGAIPLYFILFVVYTHLFKNK